MLLMFQNPYTPEKSSYDIFINVCLDYHAVVVYGQNFELLASKRFKNLEAGSMKLVRLFCRS